MWRDLVRWVFVRLRLVPLPDFVVKVMDRHPTPADLEEGIMIVVQDGDRRKWCCFRCPGGCGEKLQLSLNQSRRPSWGIAFDWLRRPSVTPSVHQLNACRCHFWVKGGSIDWCSDSGHDKRNISLSPKTHAARAPTWEEDGR